MLAGYVFTKDYSQNAIKEVCSHCSETTVFMLKICFNQAGKYHLKRKGKIILTFHFATADNGIFLAIQRGIGD